MVTTNITLTLNKEYTYKQICEELGWNASKGNARKKHIRIIEESFEFYHPINEKTNKPKTTYIFTKMIKEPQFIDYRQFNESGKTNGGRKSEFDDEEFTYLLSLLLADCKKYLFEDNCVYFPNTKLYKTFGFYYIDVFKDLSELYPEYSFDLDVFNMLFKHIVFNILKDLTFTKVCRKIKSKRNSIPKGLIYMEGKGRKSHLAVLDDYEMENYQIWEDTFRECNSLKNEFGVLVKGKKAEEIKYIEYKMKEEYGYECVRKVNKVYLEGELLDKVNNFKYDEDKVHECRVHLFEVLSKRVDKKVRSLCDDLTSSSAIDILKGKYHCEDWEIRQSLYKCLHDFKEYGETHIVNKKEKESKYPVKEENKQDKVSPLEEKATTTPIKSSNIIPIQEVIHKQKEVKNENYDDPKRDYSKLSFSDWFECDDDEDMICDISSLDRTNYNRRNNNRWNSKKEKEREMQEYYAAIYG